MVGSYGTRLDYAPYVIGDPDSEQAWMHQDIWWTLSDTIFEKAKAGVERLFRVMAEEMARWLDGKGL
ncbi:MAG: hypothetical protein EHM35_06890 [Planctomycetaceae bacterium]|nr:MAG: hypothetical protein EHM35_06890 [Planctomycetaceae bacterium]